MKYGAFSLRSPPSLMLAGINCQISINQICIKLDVIKGTAPHPLDGTPYNLIYGLFLQSFLR